MQYIDMQQQTRHTCQTITKTKTYHILCIGTQAINTDWQCLKNEVLIVLNGKKAHQSLMKIYKKIG